MPPAAAPAQAHTASPQVAADALKSAPNSPAYVETTVSATATAAVVEPGNALPQGEMVNVLMTRSVPQLKAIRGQEQGFPESVARRLIAAGAAVLPLGRHVSASAIVRK